MVLLLAGAVLAGTPENWLVAPVAAELHPVGWNYGARYEQVLSETLGDARARPVFRTELATADVHYHLVASSGEGLWIDRGTAADWRDVAAAVAVVSTSRLLDETASRTPVFAAFYTAVDTVVNPRLHLERRRDGAFDLVHRPAATADARLERADWDLGLPNQRPPAVDLGLDWHLRGPDDPPGSPALDYGAFLSLSDVLLSNIRADFRVRAGQWSVSTRHRIYPRVFIVGVVRSSDAVATPLGAPAAGDFFTLDSRWADRKRPARASAGLVWNVPNTSGWSARLDRVWNLDDTGSSWVASVRGEFGFPRGMAQPTRPAGATTFTLPAGAPLSLTSMVTTPTAGAGPTSRFAGPRSPGRR